MVSTMDEGMGKTCPRLEKNFLFNGFQNARIPSYFSNSHLLFKVEGEYASIWGV